MFSLFFSSSSRLAGLRNPSPELNTWFIIILTGITGLFIWALYHSRVSFKKAFANYCGGKITWKNLRSKKALANNYPFRKGKPLTVAKGHSPKIAWPSCFLYPQLFLVWLMINTTLSFKSIRWRLLVRWPGKTRWPGPDMNWQYLEMQWRRLRFPTFWSGLLHLQFLVLPSAGWD